MRNSEISLNVLIVLTGSRQLVRGVTVSTIVSDYGLWKLLLRYF